VYISFHIYEDNANLGRVQVELDFWLQSYLNEIFYQRVRPYQLSSLWLNQRIQKLNFDWFAVTQE
jgi:hypothetical protein